MRAIIIEQFGGPEKFVIQNIRDPEPKPGHVVIEVKAFKVNHAETHMRKGEWAESAKVSGIECLGVVKACPSGEFSVGQKVAAFMGRMGRTINGSYASVSSRNFRRRNWRQFRNRTQQPGLAHIGTSSSAGTRRSYSAGQHRHSARRR